MLEVNLQLLRGAFALDACFTAPTPGVTALFGRSGCGKTTVVNLIAGLLRGRGQVILNGECWLDTTHDIHISAEHRRVGYVFQDARLFPHYSVRGNLLYGAGRTPRGGDFNAVVELLGLQALLQRRPGALSGGERQRVALGRALLSGPQLLLLDEPLASLDQSRRDEVLPYLERLRDHFSIPMIFVSHQFDEVLRLATHLVVMDQGRVLASGDVGSVSLHPAVRDIVGHETVGAVIDGKVVRIDTGDGLAEVVISGGVIRVPAQTLAENQEVRLQLLARDIILAIEEPTGLSVRNQLRGTVMALSEDQSGALVELDAGGTRILSRVTIAAVRELALRPGLPVWMLVKAVSVSRHAFRSAELPARRAVPAPPAP